MSHPRSDAATAYVQPATSWVGVGAIDELASELARFQVERALIVTDRTLSRTRLMDSVRTRIADAGAEAVVFDGIVQNPSTQTVDDAVERYRAEACDAIVSFGGGSSHDTAKAIRLLLANGGRLEDYEGVNEHLGRGPPHVAVNTTAGTGAELSHYCFITDRTKGRRLIIFDRQLAPDVNISDPVMHQDMPPRLTAETGMNALTHAIEATLSTAGTAFTRAISLEAVHLISKNLPRAYANGRDLQARSAMAQAEFMAGVAYNSAGFGLADSLSMAICAVYDASHSAMNATLLPHVMRYNLLSAQTRLASVAVALGEPAGIRSEREQAERAILAVERMNRDLGIADTLAGFGIDESVIYTSASAVLKHPFNARNPRPVTEESIRDLFLDAIGGKR